MDCHRSGRRASARYASALLAVSVLLASAATGRLGGSRARSVPLAETAYSAPLSAPLSPQARKNPGRVIRGKSHKSRASAKHRKTRRPVRAAHGWKPGHAKPSHAKPAHHWKSAHSKPKRPKQARSKPARAKKPAPAKRAVHSAPLPPASNAKAAKAVHEALSLLGIPYRWGGTTRAGFDCSGFTQHVWAAAGVKIPRTVSQQAEAGTPVPLNRAQPGDLVVFYPNHHHVGIYIGNNMVVDSPHTGSWVRTDPIRSMPVSVVVRPHI